MPGLQHAQQRLIDRADPKGGEKTALVRQEPGHCRHCPLRPLVESLQSYVLHILTPTCLAVDQMRVDQAVRVAASQYLLHAGKHLVACRHRRHGHVEPTLLARARPVIGQVEGRLCLAGTSWRLDDHQGGLVQMLGQFDDGVLRWSGREREQLGKGLGLRRRTPADPAELVKGLPSLFGRAFAVADRIHRQSRIREEAFHRAKPVCSRNQAGEQRHESVFLFCRMTQSLNHWCLV